MTELSKEGAGRPLCESAPKIAPKPLAKAYLWGAAASYPLAYLYTRRILFFAGELGWEILLFALLFVAGVEAMARTLHRKASPEMPLWAGCWLVLSCVMPLWGVQPALTGWQVVVWHLFAIWFVLARCGMLAQGYTGSLCFLDGLMGGVVLPFGNFFRRIAAVGAGLHALAQHRVKLRQTAVAVGTVLLTLLLCGTAWQLLAAADANFAALGQGLDRWLDELLNSYRFVETFIYFLLSLPVGAWLYGLVAGSLHRETPPCTGDRFFALLQPVRVLPAVTANVVVGALSLIYTLFFVLQAAEWFAAAPLGLTAPVAASFAVDGFWELLRILLMNFCVLAAIRFLGRQPLPKALAALFCGYGVAFAVLAGAKLATYIHLFGYTPRRVVAGWFLCVLAVWAVLLLVRVFRVLTAARIGLAVLAVSFVVLSCTDLESRIVKANVARYTAGVDAELDLDVLRDCGLNYWQRGRDRTKVVTYTRWLLDAGWFTDRSIQDLLPLYNLTGSLSVGQTQEVELDDTHGLRLTFDVNGRCTSAALTTREKGV